MKLNMQAQIIGPNGKALEVDGTPLLLRDVLINALSSPGPAYQEEPAEQKFKRGMLAIKAHMSDDLDITAEEASVMKKCVAYMFAPVIVYRAHRALDGESMNPEAVATNS